MYGELISPKGFLRADVCKYRPGVGKMKISKNPKKIQWTTLGTLFMTIKILLSSVKYFCNTASVKIDRFTASTGPLFLDA